MKLPSPHAALVWLGFARPTTNWTMGMPTIAYMVRASTAIPTVSSTRQ